MEAWRERALNAAAAIQERSKPLLEKGMKATQSTIAAIKESETVQSMQQSYSSWREREGSSDSEGLPATATKAVDVPPPWSVFGLPLSSLPLTNYAPTLMHRCIEHIALTGSTEQEGIYRLSGGASMVRTLRYSFGSIGSGKEDPGPVALTVDPNASASVLKAFLRELSEPILTTSLLPYFTAIPITPSEDGKASALTLSQLSAFIGKLPLVHYATLRLLLLHLFDVSRNEPVNKMGVSNLAVVFSPSTLIGGDLLKVLIANANLLCKPPSVFEFQLTSHELLTLDSAFCSCVHITIVNIAFDTVIVSWKHKKGTTSPTSVKALRLSKQSIINNRTYLNWPPNSTSISYYFGRRGRRLITSCE
ncbi:Rho GTPase activation protein [Chytriomyces sp. MP71]|nr:Rho GTPase activation protein [Chytriomyces sp. MP71]